MIFHVSEVAAYEAPGEGKRVVRYLVDPERTEIQRFAIGLTQLEPGQKTLVASHEAEEVYFILEGHPLVKVGDEEATVRPETVITIPANAQHQIGAPTDRVRFYWTTSPASKPTKAKQSWRRLEP